MIRPMVRGSVIAPVRSLLSVAIAGFSPLSLFAQGEQGAWYDPSDLTTLFQDSAGTVPVVASGDPVGLMLDKSGNGNHASQSISASRPIYRTDGMLHWLEFDGVDDQLKALSAFLTGAVSRTLSVATKRSASGYIAGYGSPSASRTFALDGGDPGRIVGFADDWSFGNVYDSSGTFVTSVWYDGTHVRSQINGGTIYGPSPRAYDTGPDSPLTVGAWPHGASGGRFAGRIYSLVLVEGSLTQDSRHRLDSYIGNKAGMAL